MQMQIQHKASAVSHINRELKDVRAQKFPRTDFFKTFTAGRK